MEKLLKLHIFLLASLSFLSTGCYTTYYYLQNTQVHTSLPDDNKIIYKDRDIRDLSLSLKFDYSKETAFAGNNGMHSVVGDNDIVIIDTSYDTISGGMGYHIENRYTIVGNEFKSNNEFISNPGISMGLEIEYNISQYLFIIPSLHYARNNNYNNFRASFGLGGGYSNDNIGICGSFRAGFQSYHYAANILHGDRNSGYYTDEITKYNRGFYAGMNFGINSIKELLFLNYYLNLSMNIFEYIDVSYGEEFNYDAIMENIIITPGIFKDIGNSRITTGFTAMFLTTILNRHLKDTAGHFFPKIFLQYSYRFKLK